MMTLSLRALNLVLVFCLIAAASGCRQSNTAANHSPVVTLNFWNGFSGPDGQTMQQIVEQFNREHPNVRVKMQIIPWATYYDKVTLGLAYGGAPDVFILHTVRFPEFACYGALNRMDDLIANGTFNAADFMPRPWKAGVWKGQRFAVPLDCHPMGMYYNTDLFKKAGIVDKNGNAKPPTTLSEFLADAKKMTKDTNGDGKIDQWGFAFTYIRNNSDTFLNQFGTALLTPDMKRSDLTNPKAAQALELMQDFIHKYKIAPSPEGLNAWVGFQTGKVAMAFEGIYMISSLEEQKSLHFAGAPCPVFGDRPAVWGSSHMMVMPKNITPERRKAAVEFIRYLSDHSLSWAKGGQVPVRKSILHSKEFRELPVQYEFSKELPYATYEPLSVSYNQISPFGDAAFEASLLGIKPTKEALAEAAMRTNRVLARQ